MFKRRASIFLILFVLLGFTFTGKVSAQNYYFAVPSETVNVTITDQGTMAIDYAITFDNSHGGDAIDYVDIGLPNENYVLSSMTADVDGHAITDIQKADPSNVAIGVTLALGDYAIPSGNTGIVHLYVGEVDKVLNQYTYNNVKDYASFEFGPNTFGSDYLTGDATNFTLSLHLPKAVQSTEPIYYTPTNGWPGDATPATAYDSNGLITYTWTTANANAYTQYMFGAAFPAKYVPDSSIVKPSFFDKLGTFFAGLGITSGTITNFFCCLFFIAIFIGIPTLSAISSRKRKLQYLSPKISIEGHGIKRGLTAVEAGILMQQPMDKIMTMILFGVIKKNAAIVETKDPLKITVVKPAPDGLHPYETDFLAAMDVEGAERTTKLQAMMVALVKSVSESMKGFSLKETVAYYQDIMKRAWQDIESAGTPEIKGQKFDEYMGWTMLDKDFDNRTRNVFNTGPIFVPIWWGNFDPMYRSQSMHTSGPVVSGGAIGGGGGSKGGGISMPHLPGSDFAASMINGASTFSAGVVGNVAAFTSGVTKVTNPVPITTSSSGGGFHGGSGGGGHACACACACAGCACACAGGGR